MSETATRRKALPVALGMHVCQAVITDAETGMYSLINMFDKIVASHFPHRYPAKIFVLLSNGHGRSTGLLKLTELGTNKEIAGVPVIFQFNDPLVPMRLTVDMLLQFPNPSRYALELYLEGELIASRILTATFPQA